MITTTQKIIAGVGAVLLIAFSAVTIARWHDSKVANKSEILAHQIGVKADAAVAVATSDATVVKQDAANMVVSAKVVARVEAERAPMMEKWRERTPVPDALPTGAQDDRAILVAQLKQANDIIAKGQEDIEALHKESADKDALIASLTKRGDDWQAVAELREKQQLAQQAATDAWKRAAAEGRWEGRGEGALTVALLEALRLAIHK